MTVVAWIFLIVFGIIGLQFFRKLMLAEVNKAELFLMLFSIIVAALSAGVIWGGLFQ